MTGKDVLSYILDNLPGLAALLTAAAMWLDQRAQRKKTEADAKKADAGAKKLDINGQSIVIENLRDEVARLGTRLTHLEKDYALLQRKYEHVLEWATPLGYKPPPRW